MGTLEGEIWGDGDGDVWEKLVNLNVGSGGVDVFHGEFVVISWIGGGCVRRWPWCPDDKLAYLSS